MKTFIEPLILYWVLFFRISAGGTAPGEAVEFSVTVELARIVMYSIPSLALVWYLLLRAKSLKEWGIAFPQKKDIVPALLAFFALFLIGMTVSLVSPYFDGIPAGPRVLAPQNVYSWAILVVSCLSGAYLEESYFRFYLLSKRKELGMSPYRAVVVSALLFSLCHVYEGPWGFLNAALSGIVLAFVFLRFKSLHGISIAHALYNILVYAFGALATNPV